MSLEIIFEQCQTLVYCIKPCRVSTTVAGAAKFSTHSILIPVSSFFFFFCKNYIFFESIQRCKTLQRSSKCRWKPEGLKGQLPLITHIFKLITFSEIFDLSFLRLVTRVCTSKNSQPSKLSKCELYKHKLFYLLQKHFLNNNFYQTCYQDKSFEIIYSQVT